MPAPKLKPRCAYCQQSIGVAGDAVPVDQRLLPTLQLAGKQLLPGCDRWHKRCAVQAKRLVAASGVAIPRRKYTRRSEVQRLGDGMLAHSRPQRSQGGGDAQ